LCIISELYVQKRGAPKVAKNIRFGITAPVPGESVEGLIRFAKTAEDAGFDTLWFPDHIIHTKITPPCGRW
jgi:alkanesulfonate monooxygenase SsuD/methylene tetrahydromethanopterin reductase-like flavin-dependent oxidoreductase (luciferase family)